MQNWEPSLSLSSTHTHTHSCTHQHTCTKKLFFLFTAQGNILIHTHSMMQAITHGLLPKIFILLLSEMILFTGSFGWNNSTGHYQLLVEWEQGERVGDKKRRTGKEWEWERLKIKKLLLRKGIGKGQRGCGGRGRRRQKIRATVKEGFIFQPPSGQKWVNVISIPCDQGLWTTRSENYLAVHKNQQKIILSLFLWNMHAHTHTMPSAP